MDYKIVAPESIDFCEAVGITSDRAQELSKQLDDMVRDWSPPSGTVAVRAHHIMEHIAFFCRNTEEFSYCILLHMGWHQRRGMLLTPNR